MPSPHDFINRELPRFRAELFDLLRIPSISTDPDRTGDVAEAAEWLAARMRQAGLEAAVEPTSGHPLVLGRHRTRDRDVPTLLVYGHYDVQPPEPLGRWTSLPFEPELRDGRIWGRGAADDKSQIFLQIAAVEAALATTGLPIDLVLLFEGEEEIGSPSLGPWLAGRAGRADPTGSDGPDSGRTGADDALTADHVLVADSMMLGPGRPSLIVGMRGIAYFEIEATIGSTDLHSGQYGGAVPNPANALAAVIASLHEGGRVAIDGFYDDVVMPPEHVLEEWRWVTFDDDTFRQTAGGAELRGEPGFSTLERLWARPALDVNGLVAGYTGPGKKTVLPASALAKLSTRLVPEQDPDRVETLLREHVDRVAPDGVAFEVRKLQSNPPWREDTGGPLLTAAAGALESVFGARPSLVAHGGSIPIAPVLRDALDASLAVMGFAVPGANMHAPDEWFPADHFEKGMKTMTELYSRLAEVS